MIMTIVRPNPPFPCSIRPPRTPWTSQPSTGHLLQYDPSYDDRGCIIHCRRTFFTYTRNIVGIPYERINFMNLYNCSESEINDRYQFGDLVKVITLCDTIQLHNKIEISLTLGPDISY